MKLTIDFETRSKVDLKKCGIGVYSKSEDTEVICCAVKMDNDPTELWVDLYFNKFVAIHPNELPLIYSELFQQLIEQADIIEAHNVNFERNIYNNRLRALDSTWPEIPDHKWRCSAAKAASFALPRSLEGVSAALGLDTQKDKEGHRIMMKICKPRKPTKHNPAVWHENPEEFLKLFKYCIRDVDTEHAVSEALRDLSEKELKVWQLDQKINNRGVYIDKALCEAAIDVIEQHEHKLKKRLVELTDGEVDSPKQVAKLLAFLNKEMAKCSME